MAHADGLGGLTFTAVRAPDAPVFGVANCIAGSPELGGDACVRRVLEHPTQLAALDLIGNLCGKLKVQPLIVYAYSLPYTFPRS